MKAIRKQKAQKRGGVICYVKSTVSAVKIEKYDEQIYDTIYVEVTTTENKKVTVVTATIR